jgi:hypothetical protein
MKNNKLSKTIGFVSVLCMLMACSEKPADKEIVIVPAAPAPVTVVPVVVEKPAASNSTKITLDKNGVKLEAEKVDIKVNK